MTLCLTLEAQQSPLPAAEFWTRFPNVTFDAHPGTAFVKTSARHDYEVQFGPGDRLTHAEFELSGDAASDDALWSGLFEVMQAGYLVVSEDGFVAAASGADVAGLAIDDPVIEHPATPEELRDFLFGEDEEIEPETPGLSDLLVERGYRAAKGEFGPILRKTLWDANLHVEIEPSGRGDSFSFDAAPGLAISFFDPRFAVLMQRCFEDCPKGLSSLPWRKLRQDKSGCLAGGADSPFTAFPVGLETELEGAWPHRISLGALLDLIDGLAGWHALSEALFIGDLFPYTITFEERWVYLYLAFRAGETPEDMAARFASWKADHPMGMPQETVLTPEVAAAFVKAAQD